MEIQLLMGSWSNNHLEMQTLKQAMGLRQWGKRETVYGLSVG